MSVESVARPGVLITSVTVEPPSGAADERLTLKGVEAPSARFVVAGRTIWPGAATLMLTVTGVLDAN